MNRALNKIEEEDDVEEEHGQVTTTNKEMASTSTSSSSSSSSSPTSSAIPSSDEEEEEEEEYDSESDTNVDSLLGEEEEEDSDTESTSADANFLRSSSRNSTTRNRLIKKYVDRFIKYEKDILLADRNKRKKRHRNRQPQIHKLNNKRLKKPTDKKQKTNKKKTWRRLPKFIKKMSPASRLKFFSACIISGIKITSIIVLSIMAL
uniref:Wssv012 n=1 Tax=White spot syndrome virus TaxID=342409 RepID=A0A3G5BHP5_9VIRU|nr:wssv012 [White spot syndrome virus]